MEEELLCVFVALLARRNEFVDRRRLLRNLRDKSDPMRSMRENVFVQNFRFPKSFCRDLIQQLEPYDTQKSSLPFTVRFLASLYFYGHGSFQKCVGNSYPISMSQASVSRAVHHISKLIVDIKGKDIYFPKTLEENESTKEKFYKAFGMKGTVGVLGCAHVGIVTPPATDSRKILYMNKKGYYSINVEGVCDHRSCFTYINAKFPGSCHDADIWQKSSVRKNLIEKYKIEKDLWLLGGRGYPLEPWLITPVVEPKNAAMVKFNELHAVTSDTIKKAFGALKSRFRCLSKQRILHYSHERAANIIYACSILHNILLNHGVTTEIDQDGDETEYAVNDNEAPVNNGYLAEGERVRSRLIMSLN